MKELYERYKRCVVQITVRTQVGDLTTGTGFHIGDGYIALEDGEQCAKLLHSGQQ